MKAEEKAKELYNNFYALGVSARHHSLAKYSAKQCALLCVEEMQKVEQQILEGIPSDYVYTFKPNLEELKSKIKEL